MVTCLYTLSNCLCSSDLGSEVLSESSGSPTETFHNGVFHFLCICIFMMFFNNFHNLLVVHLYCVLISKKNLHNVLQKWFHITFVHKDSLTKKRSIPFHSCQKNVIEQRANDTHKKETVNFWWLGLELPNPKNTLFSSLSDVQLTRGSLV